MPVFQYKGLAANGAVTQGQIEAGGRQEAFRLIEAKGLRPISLAESGGATGRNGKPAPAKPGNGALAKVAHAPYGPLLLGIVAAGLIGFGAFSLVESRYRRV